VDIKTVSSWLGHSTAKLTLDTYGHLMGTDADRAALDRVNKALGNPAGTQRSKWSESGSDGEG
jgi:integrase